MPHGGDGGAQAAVHCRAGMNFPLKHLPSGTTWHNNVRFSDDKSENLSQGLNLHRISECQSCNISSDRSSLLIRFHVARIWKKDREQWMFCACKSNLKPEFFYRNKSYYLNISQLYAIHVHWEMILSYRDVVHISCSGMQIFFSLA